MTQVALTKISDLTALAGGLVGTEKIELESTTEGSVHTTIDAIVAKAAASVEVPEVGTTAGTVAAGDDTRIVNAIQSSEKGAAGGVVPLNESSVIDSVYLPSYVDDVLEYADRASFPTTGETGKIYIAIDTNLSYRWSGSDYQKISDGEVTSVNGRKGIVTGLAEADDVYTKTESDAKYKDIAATTSYNDLEDMPAVIAAGGTQADARTAIGAGTSDLQIGTVSGTAAEGNDPRITGAVQTTALPVSIPHYSLPEVTTTGELDLSAAQCFIVSSGTGRSISITNAPATNRSFVVVIKIEGPGSTTWPAGIDWIEGSTPVLGSSYTVVSLLRIGGSWIGNVTTAVDA